MVRGAWCVVRGAWKSPAASWFPAYSLMILTYPALPGHAMRLRYVELACCCALLTVGCHPDRSKDWDAFITSYLDSTYAADPVTAVNLGLHQYDGRLADLSDAGLKKEIARLHAARDRAAAFDTAGLDDARRFDREYLIAILNGNLFWMEKAEWPWKNPQYSATEFDPAPYIT